METSLIRETDFILFGLQPWDIPIGSNCKNIAMEIARHNRVLYVNRPVDRIHYYRHASDPQISARIASIKDGKNVLTQVQPNVTAFNPRVVLESINWLPPGKIYQYLNRRNVEKLAREIKWASNELGFKNPILLIDNDFFNGLYLKEALQPRLFIHYIRDYLLSQQYFIKHGTKAEPAIMAKADAVAANSQYLANYARQYNPLCADVGQGCDVEDFLKQPATVPADIANIPYPIIGYMGSITSTRLDIELVRHIATERPQWQVVLVGPEDDAFKQSSLHQLTNVHFLGGKQPADLPAYVHAFDVCINPQLLNQMTIGNYPRKVDEYLAAGKPVVATRTEAMQIFGDLSILCDSKEDYIGAIERALEEQHVPERIAQRKTLAQSHTWEASVKAIYQLIQSTGK